MADNYDSPPAARAVPESEYVLPPQTTSPPVSTTTTTSYSYSAPPSTAPTSTQYYPPGGAGTTTYSYSVPPTTSYGASPLSYTTAGAANTTTYRYTTPAAGYAPQGGVPGTTTTKIIPPQNVGTSTVVPQTTMTTTQQVTGVVGLNPNLGRAPVSLVCPYCKQPGVTSVRNQPDECTMIAVVVLLLTVWILFWIPLVSPECQATEHYCPNCHQKLGETKGCQ